MYAISRHHQTRFQIVLAAPGILIYNEIKAAERCLQAIEYVERKGHPRLRMRHLPFAIDQAGADAWMVCMFEALDATVEDEELRSMIELNLGKLAYHMVNR